MKYEKATCLTDVWLFYLYLTEKVFLDILKWAMHISIKAACFDERRFNDNPREPD